MTVLLVRHAHAQGRGSWSGADDDRPLTKRGRRQADGLLERFGERPITRVLSSPALRCIDSVEPLAAKAGVTVTPERALAEDAEPAAVLALARALAAEADGDSVLCTHGDVIPDVLRLLAKDGVTLRDELMWAKGSTWVLDTDGARITQAAYVPPAS